LDVESAEFHSACFVKTHDFVAVLEQLMIPPPIFAGASFLKALQNFRQTNGTGANRFVSHFAPTLQNTGYGPIFDGLRPNRSVQ